MTITDYVILWPALLLMLVMDWGQHIVSRMREVIDEYVNTLPESERETADSIISLETFAEMNSVGGRPSDCARSAVADHRSGRLTAESFRKAREDDPRYANQSRSDARSCDVALLRSAASLYRR